MVGLLRGVTYSWYKLAGWDGQIFSLRREPFCLPCLLPSVSFIRMLNRCLIHSKSLKTGFWRHITFLNRLGSISAVHLYAFQVDFFYYDIRKLLNMRINFLKSICQRFCGSSICVFPTSVIDIWDQVKKRKKTKQGFLKLIFETGGSLLEN